MFPSTHSMTHGIIIQRSACQAAPQTLHPAVARAACQVQRWLGSWKYLATLAAHGKHCGCRTNFLDQSGSSWICSTMFVVSTLCCCLYHGQQVCGWSWKIPGDLLTLACCIASALMSMSKAMLITASINANMFIVIHPLGWLASNLAHLRVGRYALQEKYSSWLEGKVASILYIYVYYYYIYICISRTNATLVGLY